MAYCSAYATDKIRHQADTEVPQKLDFCLGFKQSRIATSEAAVERSFGVHKLIHSPMGASLSNEIVEIYLDDVIMDLSTPVWQTFVRLKMTLC